MIGHVSIFQTVNDFHIGVLLIYKAVISGIYETDQYYEGVN